MKTPALRKPEQQRMLKTKKVEAILRLQFTNINGEKIQSRIVKTRQVSDMWWDFVPTCIITESCFTIFFVVYHNSPPPNPVQHTISYFTMKERALREKLEEVDYRNDHSGDLLHNKN